MNEVEDWGHEDCEVCEAARRKGWDNPNSNPVQDIKDVLRESYKRDIQPMNNPTTHERAKSILAKDAKLSPTVWTDVAQDLARGFLAALERVDSLEAEINGPSGLREQLVAARKGEQIEFRMRQKAEARLDALTELLKRAGMYTAHHSYCYVGVDYVTCICGLEEFSKEVLEAVSESS